ncbi:Protein of unknown function [Cotesia congregata]|uniref:Uncharacterized protein n=1 Tax=Cotesia congregata TaxID=51543 RepID=A0A8J2MMH8_COTCN|nr:Protein of unknown function [Cotesia congregata]
MMYSPDKMMGSKGLHGTPISAPGCFPSGRYSPPSYRSGPESMPPPPPPRRCMPNPGFCFMNVAKTCGYKKLSLLEPRTFFEQPKLLWRD